MNLPSVDWPTALGLGLVALAVVYSVMPRGFLGGIGAALPSVEWRRSLAGAKGSRVQAERLARTYPPETLAAAFILAKETARPDELMARAKSMAEGPGPVVVEAK